MNAEEHIHPSLVLVNPIATDLHAPGTVVTDEWVLEFPSLRQHVKRTLRERVRQHRVPLIGFGEGQDVLTEVLCERFDRILTGHTNPFSRSCGRSMFIRKGAHEAMETEYRTPPTPGCRSPGTILGKPSRTCRARNDRTP